MTPIAANAALPEVPVRIAASAPAVNFSCCHSGGCRIEGDAGGDSEGSAKRWMVTTAPPPLHNNGAARRMRNTHATSSAGNWPTAAL